MKIFIIPYTFHTFFSYHQRVSGVDEAMLKQINVLRERGHSVEVYIPFGDLHQYMDGIHYHKDYVPEGGIKPYVRNLKNKNNIIKDILIKMIKFKPDVILSNAYFQKKLYNELQKINAPIVYMSHAVPGFMADLMTADDLSEFVKQNSLCAVSQYHANRLKTYYGRKRKGWKFTDPITADSIVFSSYSDKETVCESEGVVKHVSAAHKEKQTFLIHDVLESTDIKSEVFTTVAFMGKEKQKDVYVTKALEKYNTPERPIHFEISHSEIMENIKTAACCFVGLTSYDTFTITSLEALSRGVPIIVKGFKGSHPAKEMLEPEYQQYVHIYENKTDFVNKAREFLELSLEQRQQIAESCYRVTSKKHYGDSLELALAKAITKFNKNEKNDLLFG